MWVGLGIFLLVVGAILSFAVRDSIDAVDLTMIGYILMGGGALAVLLSLIMGSRRTAAGGPAIRTVSHVDRKAGTRVEEHRVDGL